MPTLCQRQRGTLAFGCRYEGSFWRAGGSGLAALLAAIPSGRIVSAENDLVRFTAVSCRSDRPVIMVKVGQ